MFIVLEDKSLFSLSTTEHDASCDLSYVGFIILKYVSSTSKVECFYYKNMLHLLNAFSVPIVIIIDFYLSFYYVVYYLSFSHIC